MKLVPPIERLIDKEGKSTVAFFMEREAIRNGLVVTTSQDLANEKPGLGWVRYLSDQGVLMMGTGTQWIQVGGGAMGPKGDPGPQGPRGLRGEKGDTGERGPQGVVGPIGETGPQGDVGPQGPRGEQGEVGPQGDQGIQGVKGDTGEQGPRGFQGERGETGPQGEKGDTGERGPQGIPGQDGIMHSIVAGENVIVDNTDPANPIVSSAPGVPAGMKGQFAGSAPPPGWLERDGSVLLRADFPALFAAIGTIYNTGGETELQFRVPDDRGLFERSLDRGAGIDPGRVLGSLQQDQNKSHTHTGTASSAGAHTHSGSTNSTGAHTHSVPMVSGSSGGSSADRNRSGTSNNQATSSAGNHTHTLTINSGGAHTHTLSIDSEGGTEVRVKNRASLAVIKF